MRGCQEQIGGAKEVGFWFGNLGFGGAIHRDREPTTRTRLVGDKDQETSLVLVEFEILVSH